VSEGDQSTWRRVKRATTGLTNIVVVGSAAVGAAALQSWPILALGGVAYGALVAWDLASGKSRKVRTAAETVTLDADLDAFHDAQTQGTVRTILGAKAEIERVMAETPHEVQGQLALALTSVAELEERAARLAARAEDVAGYLKTTDPRVVDADCQSLVVRLSKAKDAEVRAQYESALAARREHLEVLRDLANAKERIDATLMSIASTLEALPAKIVRMRALDAQATDQMSGDVKEELDRMNSEIRTFEETLKTLNEVVT
jgi:hypothetical protein